MLRQGKPRKRKKRTGPVLLAAAILCAGLGQGCLMTRVLTVPMRITGAALTVIPYAGDAAHEGLDQAAASIDDIPF